MRESMQYFNLDNDSAPLVLHNELGTLSLLRVNEEGQPRLLRQQQFTIQEITMLRPMLELYPNYCPHEVLFAHHYGTVNEQTITHARKRLNDALLYGTWDHEMRPMRNVLSRTRLKLKAFEMDLRSILETGYILLKIGEVYGDRPDSSNSSRELLELATARG